MAFKLPNHSVEIPQDVLHAIEAWDASKLNQALSQEFVYLPVYIPDDWTYPHALFYLLNASCGRAELYWKSGGREGDPRPLIDVFLNKGAPLDWDVSMTPDEPETLRQCFGFVKEVQHFDQLFSTMREVLNNHLAEILVPYFCEAGSQFHLPSYQHRHGMLAHFLDGMFFNENVLRFKQLITPDSLHILTLLDEKGCLDQTYLQREADEWGGVVAHYWQAWQDLQFKTQLQKTLPSSTVILRKGFI